MSTALLEQDAQATNTVALPLTTSGDARLADLAQRINHAHCLAEAALNSGLKHALEAGHLLLQAKTLCTHGTWLPWLKREFQGSKRTAQAYMRLSREYPRLKAKAPRVALLSMRQAIVNVANDTQIVAKSDHPAEVIKVWEKENCQNARRAAARAEVIRTTHEAPQVPTPKPAQQDDAIEELEPPEKVCWQLQREIEQTIMSFWRSRPDTSFGLTLLALQSVTKSIEKRQKEIDGGGLELVGATEDAA